MEEPNRINSTVEDHFMKVFSKEDVVEVDFNRLSFKKVAEVDREFLIEPFTREEILIALKECDGYKVQALTVLILNF